MPNEYRFATESPIPEKKAHESSEEREPSKISPKPAVRYWARLRYRWVAASRCSSTLRMAKPPCASPTLSSPGSPKIHLPSDFQSSQQKNGNGCKGLFLEISVRRP